jgi:hypothetical protein
MVQIGTQGLGESEGGRGEVRRGGGELCDGGEARGHRAGRCACPGRGTSGGGGTLEIRR